jgi:hypothetical protein
MRIWDGEFKPLTGPLDCSTCNGSGYEGVTARFIPHMHFGDPECCGFLFGIVVGEFAYVGCNDCHAILLEVSADELQGTLTEMELTLDTCTEQCPHCKSVNLIVGFSKMFAYTCKNCGEIVKLVVDPNVERFFGEHD